MSKHYLRDLGKDVFLFLDIVEKKKNMYYLLYAKYFIIDQGERG